MWNRRSTTIGKIVRHVTSHGENIRHFRGRGKKEMDTERSRNKLEARRSQESPAYDCRFEKTALYNLFHVWPPHNDQNMHSITPKWKFAPNSIFWPTSTLLESFDVWSPSQIIVLDTCRCIFVKLMVVGQMKLQYLYTSVRSISKLHAQEVQSAHKADTTQIYLHVKFLHVCACFEESAQLNL